MHQSLIKAIKILPKNTIFYKQDWFTESKHEVDFFALEDARYSDVAGYQLILLSPQTYFITRVNLTDLENFKGAKFNLEYSLITEREDLIRYSLRRPGALLIFKKLIPFIDIVVDIPVSQ
jgi:hypothetical protein